MKLAIIVEKGVMTMSKISKTNAMRLLDQADIAYQTHTYEHHNEAVDGEQVAALLNQDPSQVFKTLICVGHSRQYYVFMVPVNASLHLKQAAHAVHEKKVEMISVKDITKISGYVRGGCSPLGMKKQFITVINQSALQYETIIYSGGKIGLQIECDPKLTAKLIKAEFADIMEGETHE